MRKKILALGLAALTLLAFTGCRKADKEEPGSTTVEYMQEQTTTQETAAGASTETAAEDAADASAKADAEASAEASTDEGNQTADLNGSLEDILAAVYANADLDPDLRQAMQGYMTSPIDADSEEYLLGTTDLEYEEAVCSVPMISSVAYQCVLVRLPEGADAEAAKQLLLDSADPSKWVCVTAEAAAAESIGNLVIMIMANQETVDAVTASFLGLEA